jgi:hypothetical protein
MSQSWFLAMEWYGVTFSSAVRWLAPIERFLSVVSLPHETLASIATSSDQDSAFLSRVEHGEQPAFVHEHRQLHPA